MKKNYAFIAAFAALTVVSSCSKDKSAPAKDSSTATTRTSSAGDGKLDVLGYGYNVTGEYGNSSAATFKVIDIARLQSDAPNRVEVDLSKKQEGKLVTSENAESYSKKLSATLKATVGFAVFNATITGSYSDASSFSSKYVYSSYDLVIQEKRVKFNSTIDLLKNYVTPEFTADVQNNSAAYIVNKYGTHVLSDIILGAKLQVLYRSETSKSDRVTAAAAGLDVSIKKVFSLNTGLNFDQSSTNQNSSQSIHYKTYGGNPAISLIGTLSLDQTAPTINTVNWQASSTVENAELIGISNDGLIGIYELIANAGKRAEVESYVKQYMLDHNVQLGSDITALHRYFNGSTGDHYYSNFSNENPAGYNYEGIEAYVYKSPFKDAVPFYRYFNGTDHFYTMVPNANAPGYTYEGIQAYVYKTQVSGTVPLYRYYNGNDHFYSTFTTIPPGYHSEEVAAYVYKTQP